MAAVFGRRPPVPRSPVPRSPVRRRGRRAGATVVVPGRTATLPRSATVAAIAPVAATAGTLLTWPAGMRRGPGRTIMLEFATAWPATPRAAAHRATVRRPRRAATGEALLVVLDELLLAHRTITVGVDLLKNLLRRRWPAAVTPLGSRLGAFLARLGVAHGGKAKGHDRSR